MKQKTHKTRRPRIWQTTGLRITAFPRKPITASRGGVWERLTGTPPETSEIKPREDTLTEAGAYPFLDTAFLTFKQHPSRIDWLLTVRHDEGSLLVEESLFLGAFEKVCDDFCELMRRWFKQAPPLQRLAFGASLLLPVNTLVEANRELDLLLPSVKVDLRGTRDLSYQINRRRNSRTGAKGLEINRLSRWAATQITGMMIQLVAGAEQKVTQTEILYACRLELDINTAQEFKAGLSKSRLNRHLDELTEFASEIAKKGDIA